MSESLQPARKRGRPTARERVQRREEILAAALPVFLENGFGGTTIDELAAAAQVTKRTIYSYFGDKAGVFTEMVHSLATTVSNDPTADQTLESVATRIVYRLNSAELIGLHWLVIAESRRFPELAVTLQENGPARHVERLASHLAAERGPDVAPRAQVLFTLLLGEGHRRRLHGLLGPITEAEAREHVAWVFDLLGLTAERRSG